MKIQNEYPNYTTVLFFFIEDKNPVLASNDSKIYSYFISLKNSKKGYDYYELTKHSNGGVFFSVVTMLGLKTIVRTNSEVYFDDLSEYEWNTLIHKITMEHFFKDEYLALKKGYSKKSRVGCIIVFIFLTLIVGILFLLKILWAQK